MFLTSKHFLTSTILFDVTNVFDVKSFFDVKEVFAQSMYSLLVKVCIYIGQSASGILTSYLMCSCVCVCAILRSYYELMQTCYRLLILIIIWPWACTPRKHAIDPAASLGYIYWRYHERLYQKQEWAHFPAFVFSKW